MEMTDDEARGIARQYTGVWWNRWSRKFVAEIYISGKRQALGSYRQAEDAGAAYAQARAERPPRTRKPKANSFAQVYRTFLEQCEYGDGTERMWPARGQQMVYDGQVFVVGSDRAYRKLGGKTVPGIEWQAECRDCGEEFDYFVALSGDLARGIVRRCPEHRRTLTGVRFEAPLKREKPSARSAAKRTIASPEPTGPSEADAIVALGWICEQLSASYDTMTPPEFAQAATRMAPEFGPVGWLPRLRDNPQRHGRLDLAAGVVRFTD